MNVAVTGRILPVASSFSTGLVGMDILVESVYEAQTHLAGRIRWGPKPHILSHRAFFVGTHQANSTSAVISWFRSRRMRQATVVSQFRRSHFALHDRANASYTGWLVMVDGDTTPSSHVIVYDIQCESVTYTSRRKSPLQLNPQSPKTTSSQNSTLAHSTAFEHAEYFHTNVSRKWQWGVWWNTGGAIQSGKQR